MSLPTTEELMRKVFARMWEERETVADPVAFKTELIDGKLVISEVDRKEFYKADIEDKGD